MTPYTNRELSWLEFNQRVLEESKREDLPLLERLKFLSISASNLDEFFQVRIGGLTEQQRRGDYKTDPAGMTVTRQLYETRERATKMMQEQYTEWTEALLPKLEDAGIKIKKPSELSGQELQELKDRVVKEILPILTPIALQYEESPVPIPALQVCLICKLESQAAPARYALLPIPNNLPRFVTIHEAYGEIHYLLLEEVISYHLSEIFPHERVTECSVFRLTKNSDIVVEDEDARDLAGEMQEVLTKRRFGNTVRVEIPLGTNLDLRKVIEDQTGAEASFFVDVPSVLGLSDIIKLTAIPGFEEHKFAPWKSQTPSTIDPDKSIFDTIDEGSVLLMHPYESFEPVVKMIEEAAEDPDTLAIKQVLYRTASKSRIIAALKKAALNGKQVTVLIELKARFDEARNLVKAEELQRAGVQVIYGVKGFKTHAKASLIMRKTSKGIRRYVHLGTGNYNETTAHLYTDISYLSSNPELGQDTSLFFNMLTGHSKMTRFQKLRPAPTLMKRHLLDLIAGEAKLAKNGQPARILGKMNSLQDPEIIDALYAASQAGVEILLNVRGICCLQPRVSGVSDNIMVTSIIDRYLEHTRAFVFDQAGEQKVFISSADWMVRNLDKRLELLIPIEEECHKIRIIQYLESCFDDNTNSYVIQSDGASEKVVVEEGTKPFRFQKHLYRLAQEQNKKHDNESSFQPHTTPSKS